MDARTAIGIIGELLIANGVIDVWGRVLVPVLRAAGRRWEQTGAGVDIEHVLTEAILESLRAYSAFLASPPPGRPILLAGAPDDTHTLPLHALGVCMREHRLPSLLLGGRVPFEALLSAAKRTGAAGIFIWRQMTTTEDTAAMVKQVRRDIRPTTALVLGGPGWDELPIQPAVKRPATLAEAAVDLIDRTAR